MGMRSWAKKLFGIVEADPIKRLDFDGEGIRFEFDDRAPVMISWQELDDITLHLVGGGGRLNRIHYLFRSGSNVVRVARSTPGFRDLDERLMKLSGFDRRAYANAMRSADDLPIVVWERNDVSSSRPASDQEYRDESPPTGGK